MNHKTSDYLILEWIQFLIQYSILILKFIKIINYENDELSSDLFIIFYTLYHECLCIVTEIDFEHGADPCSLPNQYQCTVYESRAENDFGHPVFGSESLFLAVDNQRQKAFKMSPGWTHAIQFQ